MLQKIYNWLFRDRPKHQCDIVNTKYYNIISQGKTCVCIYCGYENHTFKNHKYPYPWVKWENSKCYCSKSPVNATWNELICMAVDCCTKENSAQPEKRLDDV